MEVTVDDPRIKRILTWPQEPADWDSDLQRFKRGDLELTRYSVGESSVKALQRMLIFLGYSTTTRGAFTVDGDFGRGTNRGLAQFQHEAGLNPLIEKNTLLYACDWRNAHINIDGIPDAILDVETMQAMLQRADYLIRNQMVMCGTLDEALRHIDAVHGGRYMNCREILAYYADDAVSACERVLQQTGNRVHPRWVLAIIKKETSGIVRPRFEQHYMTRLGECQPAAEIRELRLRSMSFGLGQILGENFRRVGADTVEALITSPISEQVYHVARFLSQSRFVAAVRHASPEEKHFHQVAKHYNGAGYMQNHYHESLQRWFAEFARQL